jgi:hypothetical protein
VRLRDVHVGETYLVEVPHRLPASRYPADVLGFGLWWQLAGLRGTRFHLTVTETGVDLAGTPAVEGLRVHTGSHGVVDLTVEQVAALGLPPGVYRIQGVVQRLDGGLVELPDVQTLRVAVRWLHPLDQPRPPHIPP